MVYDCFIFNKELDILEIRLHELDKVVDKFVLVEATVTHTNQRKKLYYKENKKLFKEFSNKIIHIVVKDMPDVTVPWILNDHQFSAISRGLVNCKLTDIILLGDVDEIPKAEKVIEAKKLSGKNKVFEQKISWYYLNYVLSSKRRWHGTHMLTFGQLQKYKTAWIAKSSRTDLVVTDGGWHFTWMGSVKDIQKKLSSTIHQELNIDATNTPEKISMAISEGRDPFNIGMKFIISSLDFLPQFVKENKEKYKHLLIETKNLNKKSNFDKKISNIQHAMRIYILRPIKRITDNFINS